MVVGKVALGVVLVAVLVAALEVVEAMRNFMKPMIHILLECADRLLFFFAMSYPPSA